MGGRPIQGVARSKRRRMRPCPGGGRSLPLLRHPLELFAAAPASTLRLPVLARLGAFGQPLASRAPALGGTGRVHGEGQPLPPAGEAAPKRLSVASSKGDLPFAVGSPHLPTVGGRPRRGPGASPLWAKEGAHLRGLLDVSGTAWRCHQAVILLNDQCEPTGRLGFPALGEQEIDRQ